VSLQGLPDFQRPLQGSRFEIYYPYELAGGFVVASNALEIATTRADRPDFLLELVRGLSPALPPAPYAVLDFRLRARYPAEEALALLRERHAGATVIPGGFRGGLLRFQPAADTPDVPPDLVRPVSLTANGLGSVRCVRRLSRESAAVLEGAVRGDVLGLSAWAEMEMEGVAPRVPVRVSFDPAELLRALAALARHDSPPVITRVKLEEFFDPDVTRLPLAIEGTVERDRRRDFVETMADHVRCYYGEFVPSTEVPLAACMALRMDRGQPGRVTWDLTEPLSVPRVRVLSLDPFDAVRQLVASEGPAAFIRQTTVPPLDSGTRRIGVSANLPPRRLGVFTLGVHLSAPPRPPKRVQALNHTVELAAPADSATAMLRMSPAEPLEYEYSTFAVIQRAAAVERLEAAPRLHRGETLDLGVDDFPVRFVGVEATPGLLALATATGRCAGETDRGPFELGFTLTAEQPSVAIAVPADGRVAPLEFEVRARTGSRSLRLTLPASQGVQLDLPCLPEFGAHRIVIECDFAGLPTSLVAIDLTPEGREESLGAIETVVLTTAAPRKEWSYLAPSPFEAGYRYRHRANAGEPAEAWSDVRSPFEPLRLGAGQDRESGAMSGNWPSRSGSVPR
jgi:hypothetical protein